MFRRLLKLNTLFGLMIVSTWILFGCNQTYAVGCDRDDASNKYCVFSFESSVGGDYSGRKTTLFACAKCDGLERPNWQCVTNHTTTYDDLNSCKNDLTNLQNGCCLYKKTTTTGVDQSKTKTYYSCQCGSSYLNTDLSCKSSAGTGSNALATDKGNDGKFDSSDTTCGGLNGQEIQLSPSPDKVLNIGLTGAEQLNSSDLCKVNPLCQSAVFANKRTPGDITSRLVKNVVFPIAGLLLFLYIVWGGFQVVQGATMGNDNIVASGKQRVTAAIIGFLLLFASYWMWSLVELALGLGTTSK